MYLDHILDSSLCLCATLRVLLRRTRRVAAKRLLREKKESAMTITNLDAVINSLEGIEIITDPSQFTIQYNIPYD